VHVSNTRLWARSTSCVARTARGSVKATSFIPFPHGWPLESPRSRSRRPRAEHEKSSLPLMISDHGETERNGSPLLVSEWMLAEHSRAWLPSNKAMRARCGIARLYTTCGQALVVHAHVVLGYPMVSANLIPWRAPVRKWPRQEYRAVEWAETLRRPSPRVRLSCGAAVVAAAILSPGTRNMSKLEFERRNDLRKESTRNGTELFSVARLARLCCALALPAG